MENLKEYYEFLELQQNASQEEIIKRVNEKKKHFELLIQNAPNEYLKSIHKKNISKLEEIKLTLTKGYINPKEEKASHSNSFDDKTVAWLIRHTENKNAISFPLHEGNNFLGRFGFNKENEILIDDDIFVSRKHAIIHIENGTFKIEDIGSKNGTYINGNEKKIKTAFLHNSDTIQIGNTKLVLKIASKKEIENVMNEVDNSEYMRTIVIDIL
ncbi:MAG: FHA domain-containing protein [Bacteroidetes bacterium]|nr:FHA domain-containing protein [Bacteroidota bacterium]